VVARETGPGGLWIQLLTPGDLFGRYGVRGGLTLLGPLRDSRLRAIYTQGVGFAKGLNKAGIEEEEHETDS
jgi:hypothetical protein